MSKVIYWLVSWLLGANRLERLADAVGGIDNEL